MPYLLRVLLLLTGLCSACRPNEFRPCPSTHTNPTKQLYNEVLTELIEQGLLLAYLPESERAYIQQHFQNAPGREATAADSLWLRHQLVRFQQRLFQDSARFQTFYLNRSGARKYTQLAGLPASYPAVKSTPRIAALLQGVAPQQEQAALDRLNAIQQVMPPQDFQLCTARLLAAGPFRSPSQKTGVGTITLSTVVFNAVQDQALLAYGWECGGLCGYGAVLLVEKVNGHWHIKQQERTWIS